MQVGLLVEGNSQWNFVRLYSSFDREAGGQANTANPMTREIISPINQMLCLADSWRSAPPLFPIPWRWAGCDELRGDMDASQYKDHVLVLLFIKYVSDKYAGMKFAPITIPDGASFADMVALKGKSDIGDQINKTIIAPLANANQLSDMPDFNDATKLGTGKEMVDRLTNLIAIFENKALDFSKNRAEGDDILGDAYEYLMRHFATESGKYRGIGHLNGSWANIPQFPATPSSPAPSFAPGTSNLGIAASRRSIASVADMALTHPCTTLACPG